MKNIMINCSKLSFELAYEHVEAHQDDHENFAKLSVESQLLFTFWHLLISNLTLPPQRNFTLWERALLQICPSGSVNDRLR